MLVDVLVAVDVGVLVLAAVWVGVEEEVGVEGLPASKQTVVVVALEIE